MDSTLQERARATRRSLLEAAALLFAEQGYAGTSVNDISARSGRTSGAVYFHYASKEGLALAVVQHHFATWPGLAARYTDRAEPPLEKLVALSFDIAHALAEDPLARAGARLWAERDTIDAPLPDPFAL
ncbi:MAG: TetR family transcriptional regulator, partial [Streptomyces albidoflavus]